MSLSYLHQLALLHDLLSEQQSSFEGEVSEYQQIKRLVKSMIANGQLNDDQLIELLPEIYHYSVEGESVQNIEEHIQSNTQQLHNWISAIEQVKD
ncbi:YtzH-like family protein [Lentibacillus saliphilus]|uniref:YtzH-like family protein n=1 Tax=Lentibacillus saliphilus TaxID=2737028 RepID=UPI001C3108E2|nr:YtzH-like family protein [Lentibacillus saliphilus]